MTLVFLGFLAWYHSDGVLGGVVGHKNDLGIGQGCVMPK